MADHADPDKLRTKFWKELADSPTVFLLREGSSEGAKPMRAQLDKDANSAIWFYTNPDNDLMQLGPAVATVATKGHEVFARIEGTLVEETRPEVFDEHWSNFVEAWFPEGKAGARMIRFDLGDAEIWDADMGLINVAKMALGQDMTDYGDKNHVDHAKL